MAAPLTQVVTPLALAPVPERNGAPPSLRRKLSHRKGGGRKPRSSGKVSAEFKGSHGSSEDGKLRGSPGLSNRRLGLHCLDSGQTCQALSLPDLGTPHESPSGSSAGPAVQPDGDGLISVPVEAVEAGPLEDDFSRSPPSLEPAVADAAPSPGPWTLPAPEASAIALQESPLNDSIIIAPVDPPPQDSGCGLAMLDHSLGVLEIPFAGSTSLISKNPGTPGLSFPVVLVDLESSAMAGTDLDARDEITFAGLALPEIAVNTPSGSPAGKHRAAAPGLPAVEELEKRETPWAAPKAPERQDGVEGVVNQATELASTPSQAGLAAEGLACSSSVDGPGESGATVASSAVPGGSQALPSGLSGVALKRSSLEDLELLHSARDWWEQSGTGVRVSSIMGFAGPALGIWLCSPLMSLIDTAVVGSGSSLELAALGPGTIVVDNLSFLYMFLSTAAANLIATSLAEQKPAEASAHLQRLLLVALVCGAAMLLFSEFCAEALIATLAGSNRSIIPAALRYAKIRGLAWPAVLVTSVTQSASLALHDSWSPLICLSVASAVNLFGDIFLCRVLNLGIAGAAWATAASQYAACAMMLVTIVRSRKLQLGVRVPSVKELTHFMSLAGPIFLSLCAKVGFYTLVTYTATGLGTVSLAAHQVLIGIFAVCAVCAEPLSQTAQAFLPRLCVGVERNLKEAKALIQTLGVVALMLGVFEAIAAAIVSITMPSVFTADPAIASMMGSVVVPLSASLLLNPVVLAAEGVLLAGRDVSFLAFAMMTNVAVCGGLLLMAGQHHWGLVANWWIVVLFQVARIVQACRRIWSPQGIVRQAELHAA